MNDLFLGVNKCFIIIINSWLSWTQLQAIGNLEATLFGKNFQLKLPEIVLAMAVSLIAAGMVHRICFTTW